MQVSAGTLPRQAPLRPHLMYAPGWCLFSIRRQFGGEEGDLGPEDFEAAIRKQARAHKMHYSFGRGHELGNQIYIDSTVL